MEGVMGGDGVWWSRGTPQGEIEELKDQVSSGRH